MWPIARQQWYFHISSRPMGGKALIKVICNALSKRELLFFVWPSPGWLVTKTLERWVSDKQKSTQGHTLHNQYNLAVRSVYFVDYVCEHDISIHSVEWILSQNFFPKRISAEPYMVSSERNTHAEKFFKLDFANNLFCLKCSCTFLIQSFHRLSAEFCRWNSAPGGVLKHLSTAVTSTIKTDFKRKSFKPLTHDTPIIHDL